MVIFNKDLSAPKFTKTYFMSKKLFGLVLLCLLSASQLFAQCTASITSSGPTTLCSGAVDTLSANSGTSYQWFLNGTALTDTNQVCVATSAGSYTVEVSNGSCNATSSAVIITIGSAPGINSQMSSASICSGANASFSFAASGSGISYQWYVSTGSGFVALTNGGVYSGATTATLSITGAPSSMSGYLYHCVVSGTCSPAATTASVSLYVNALSSATVTSVGSTYMCTGMSDTLLANTGSGYSYQWMLNGVNIAGATDSVYIAGTPGTYSVQITLSGCSVVSSGIAITVNPLPTVAIISSQQNPNCVGNWDTLNGSTGPGYTYQWLYNGAIAAGATTSSWITDSSGIYTIRVANSYGCVNSASDTVVFNAAPATPSIGSNSPVCIGDSIQLGYQNPASGSSISWSGPNSFTSSNVNPGISSATTAMSGVYTLTVLVSGCSLVNGTISVVVASCDSVWPGDVNSDHVVDNTDALDLALGYGDTGSVRPSASISWAAQYCVDWVNNIVAGVNEKHADCDGNGTVDVNDTAAINANYGLTHPKGSHQAQHKTTGLPDLYFDLTGINFVAGATVSVPIKLGSSSVPMNNILGLAAEVKIGGITLASSPLISYPVSWLGNSSSTFSFRKVIGADRIDWAYARNDHQNISGNGTMANLTFTILPNTYPQQVVLYFDNVKIINNAGNVITAYNVLDDTAMVSPSGVKNVPYSAEDYCTVVPNPSGAQSELHMYLTQQSNLQVCITDMLGKVIWTYTEENATGYKSISLPAPTITSGIYMIRIQGEGLAPHTIRWIRN